MSRNKLLKGRPTGRRRRGKRVLIVCNADVTEPAYFDHLLKELGLSRSMVVIDESLKGKDPLMLARGAGKMRADDAGEAKKEGFDSYGSVWAVTDVDLFTNLGEAQKEARHAGVELVVSNPCFEVWLIDHVKVCPEFCAYTRECEKCAEEIGIAVSTNHKRSSSGRKKAICFDKIDGRVDNALRNASAHNTDEKCRVRESDPGNVRAYSVWTDVPKVVEKLASLAQLGRRTP